MGGTSPGILRLSNLFRRSLHSFCDCASDVLTEETEKDLLIALSQILKQVNRWTHELDSEEVESDDDGQSFAAATPHSNCCEFLPNMIGDLMLLLSINNQYISHLVGNTLLAISEFLLKIDTSWDYFLHLLCYCATLAISACLGSSSGLFIRNTRPPHLDSSDAKSLLKSKLKSADFSVAAELLSALHKILKYLKKKDSDEPMKGFLDSVCTIVLNFDVDGYIYQTHKSSGLDITSQAGFEDLEGATILFASYIQFICSLVGQGSSLEDEDIYSPIICRIINIVPSLISWCHVKPQCGCNIRLSHYCCHKVLELMVKLSSGDLELSILITWMDLLQKHFEHVLLEPIYGVRFIEDGALEGSPFCSSLSTLGKQNVPSRHLQRLSVFLFLKFSLGLVKNYDNLDVSENLHKWLIAQAPADIYVNGELSSKQCLQFSLSFLRLFMPEDDILFEVLLVLLRVQFHRTYLTIEDEVKNPMVFLISHLFNPIHLFHLFLSEIFYDHQVLLDYLILKDTGSSCAEYILRSLRMVCDSMKAFIEFAGVEVNGIDGPAFSGARNCLVSLRTSIDSLNSKQLFPYNPRPLLQRCSYQLGSSLPLILMMDGVAVNISA